MWLFRQRVQARANFDIAAVSLSDAALYCRVPLFVIHAEHDDFIKVDHSRKLFAEYGGEAKEIHFINRTSSPHYATESVRTYPFSQITIEGTGIGPITTQPASRSSEVR
jgi:hypothetical protein